MIMIDNISQVAELLVVACAGIVLGCLYYGGLWLTVNRILHWRQPALGILGSLLLRLTLVAIGLYLLADGDWRRYMAALPGLLLARWWWIRRIKLKEVAR